MEAQKDRGTCCRPQSCGVGAQAAAFSSCVELVLWFLGTAGDLPRWGLARAGPWLWSLHHSLVTLALAVTPDLQMGDTEARRSELTCPGPHATSAAGQSRHALAERPSVAPRLHGLASQAPGSRARALSALTSHLLLAFSRPPGPTAFVPPPLSSSHLGAGFGVLQCHCPRPWPSRCPSRCPG